MDNPLINTVLNEDCMTVLKRLSVTNDKIFDHVITDIPYDVVSRKSAGIRVFDKEQADELVFDLDFFAQALVQTVKGNILIFCSSEQVSLLSELFMEHEYYVYLGIWEKTNPSPVNGQHFWLSGVECCVIASHNQIEDKDLIWRFPSGRSKDHPTEKPQKLMEFLVERFTKENDLVFDPCVGSGAHLLALKNKNRNYFGTELFKKYYDLIKSRGL
jgi:DNA modification methylase